MFKESEYVIYRNDVCFIKEIKKGINNKDYYVLIPTYDKSLKIEVPTSNDLNLIRKVITKEEALNLIDSIKNIKIIEQNDRLIENEYKRLLNTNEKENIISVIKTTFLRNDARIKENKKRSEKDDYYLKKAERMLYGELAISLNMNVDEVKEYIIKTINSKS